MQTENQLKNLEKGAPPFNSKTGSIAGKKGGEKSGEVKRERKKFKELLEIALNMTNETTGECYDVELVKSLINKALSGDVKAFEVIRDTVGEKPIDKVETTIKETPKIIDNID